MFDEAGLFKIHLSFSGAFYCSCSGKSTDSLANASLVELSPSVLGALLRKITLLVGKRLPFCV